MKEENQSSDDNATQAPQGIFSSPDLSVNSENHEEIKPELSEENKSRIASASAKTDATQKHDQLADQMAEQDAVSGTVIPATNSNTSTATGDIKLSGAKKKSKLPLILAGLALLTVIGGVVAWLVIGRSHSSAKEQALQEYDEYVVYLKDGPENLRTQSEDENIETDSTWFILNLRNLSLPVETQGEYTDELLTRYLGISPSRPQWLIITKSSLSSTAFSLKSRPFESLLLSSAADR